MTDLWENKSRTNLDAVSTSTKDSFVRVSMIVSIAAGARISRLERYTVQLGQGEKNKDNKIE